MGGRFASSIDFGDGDGARAARGPNDVFVAGFEAGGSLRWGRTFGGDGSDTLNDMTVAGGAPVLVGHAEGDVDFGHGVDPGLGQTDAILLRLEATTGELSAGGGFDAPFELGGSELVPAGPGMAVIAVTFESA